MHAMLAIAAKDLRQKVRDRSAIVISIVAPFALAYLFSVMLPSGANAFDPRYLFVDLDRGTIAAAVRQGPLGALTQAGATVAEAASVDAARAEVAAGDAAAAIVLPAGLSASVQAGRAAELQVIGSVNATLATQVARSALIGFADSLEAVQLSVATVLAAGSGSAAGATPDTAELARAALAEAPPIAIVAAETRDRASTDVTYYASSMAVLFVFFAAQFGVMSLLAERRAGTLARMLAAPIGPRSILVGKLLVSIVLGCISMSVIALGTTLLLGARWGDPVAVGALIAATSLAASGIALFVIGFAHNEEQAGGLTAIVAMVLAVFGGSFFRINQAPEALATLSQLTPHAWFLRGIGDLASGEGIAIVLPSLAILLTIGVATASIGLFRAGRVVVPR